MKRALGFAEVILILVLVLMTSVGCSEREKPEVKTKESLTLLHYFSGVFSGGIDALVGGFNQEQDAFLLSAIPIEHEAFKTSILKALADNNPPELYSYWAGARTGAIKDKLYPLDEVWERASLDDVFPRALMDKACMIDGQHYLLPITQHYVAFFYNKAVFERLNLDPPKTWDQFLNACEVIKASGVVPIGLGSKNQWPAQFWFDYLMLRSFPIDIREGLMQGTLAYDSPQVIKVFEIWQDMIARGYFNANPNDDDWHEGPLSGLASGQVAMTLMGTWAISNLENDYKLEAGRDFGYFDFPEITEALERVALGPIDGIIVPRESQNPQGALEAIEYLARPESQKAMALGSGAFSPSMQVSEETYGPLQREMLPSIRSADHWAFNYDLATTPERAKLGLQLFSDFLVFPTAYSELLMKLQDTLETGVTDGN